MALATPRPIWTPNSPEKTAITAFRHYVNRRYNLNLVSYRDIHSWSVNDIQAFSEAVFDFVGIKTSEPYVRVIDGLDTMWPPPRWFPGAKLNYAENMLQPGLSSKPNGIAITTVDETGPTSSTDYTFKQLELLTAAWVAALRKLGVGVGDVVAAVLPNRIDCLVLLLATASVGAIFSSTSPDMGSKGILERYRQVRPKVFVCDTLVHYSGKKIDLRGRFSEVEKTLYREIRELQHVVIINGPLIQGSSAILASKLLNLSDPPPIQYEQLPFDHPVYILYSSGTTGLPKCIIHGAGRALIMQKKEHMLGNDIGPTSTMYQYTTTGWMMWNYSIACLSTAARVVLYDGSPLYPTPAHQVGLIRGERVTHWGTSPKFLTALKQHGLPPDMRIDSLQHVYSTGSPLSTELHEWFAANFPRNVGLFSGSGGTDLVGGIVSGSVISNIYTGEISGPNLGMKVEIWDSNGVNIEETGMDGDLVITKPFFTMPLGFWGKDGEDKYRKAYFEQYPGVWYHGDLIRKNPQTGGYQILGRSDGVLNPGGVRFGSAEIYGVLEKIPELQDFICVGQKLPPNFSDERVLLFLKLYPGKHLDEALRLHIKKAIASSLSARHVPEQIHQVQDIPYTVNGKRIENLVRDIVAGKSVGPAATAINPECLVEYKRYILPSRKGSDSKL
ncbi:acetoacetate-CoA ligase [Exophiala spinifera]|uniref:Acetoacetate-CoA ligase n=1 Tax=Exophiala spinifera TaxID=91928 RepID=A0A0D2C741_9EURO|nr:acetoacetate-CoA ligase [Exophiala spinifera]KIW19384.1 acetoacetate-CoA ligase [Exophiala spinifera]